MLLRAVQSFEESDDVLLVSFGCGREARLVDTVVDQVISPLVGFLNLLLKILGVRLNVAILFLNDVVKLFHRQRISSTPVVSFGNLPQCQAFAESRYSHCSQSCLSSYHRAPAQYTAPDNPPHSQNTHPSDA